MTMLFGCTSNQPKRLNQILEPVRSALSINGPVPRWGVGYVQAGQVLLRRNPRGSELGVDFVEETAGINSNYLIGCANGLDGLRGNDNTAPFRFRRWLFAQEGSVDDFDEVRDKLAAQVPSFLGRNIKGKTSAETVFHVFLSLLHDANQLDDINLEVAVARRALRDALAIVYSSLTSAGLEADLGNVILTNGRSLLAARLGGPLFVRRLRKLDDPKLPDTEFRSVLVVSAPEMPGEGFEEIPMSSALSVTRDLVTDIVDLDG